MMTVWKCSAPMCSKDAEVMAVGTTLCKEHGGEIANLLYTLMGTRYQKEMMPGAEGKIDFERMVEEEKKRALERTASGPAKDGKQMLYTKQQAEHP